ncbi:MAG: hypothetical protein ABIP95_03385 [Pelobium sp.]
MRLFFLFIFLLFVNNVIAQDFYFSSGYVCAQGTSNVREWEIKTDSISLITNMEIDSFGLSKINSLRFYIEAKNLKSNYPLMNKRVYKALKGYQNRIYFNGVYFKISPTGYKKYLVESEGNLGIAGYNQIAKIKAIFEIKPDGTISVTGAQALKMSSFEVSPPKNLVRYMDISNDFMVYFDLVIAEDK